MKTINLNVYSFDELSEKTKRIAIDNARNDEYRLSYDWWDIVYEDFRGKAEKIGINNADFAFHLAYSQGDYTRFCKGDIDLEKVLDILDISVRHNLKAIFLNLTEAEVKGNGKAYVEPTIWNSDCSRIEEYFYKLGLKIEKELNKRIRTLEGELYNALCDEYEFLNSAEYIREKFLEMGTMFFENGEIYNDFQN